jgi:hypothetical protein
VHGGNCGERTTWIPSSTVLASTVVPASAISQEVQAFYSISFSTPAQLTAGTRCGEDMGIAPGTEYQWSTSGVSTRCRVSHDDLVFRTWMAL